MQETIDIEKAVSNLAGLKRACYKNEFNARLDLRDTRAELAQLREQLLAFQTKVARVDKLPTYWMTKGGAKMEVVSAFFLAQALADTQAE